MATGIRRWSWVTLAAVALLNGCDGGSSADPTGSGGSGTPTTVTISPSSFSLTAVGATRQLSVTIKDQAGAVMPSAPVTWASSSSSVATVSSSGLVSAVGDGTAVITALSGTATGAATVTVDIPDLTPQIQSISPSPLLEGAAATITGSGFSSTASLNQVLVGGLVAEVQSASSNQLQITVPIADCQPPRTTTVTVRVGSLESTATATVRPQTLHQLDVGGGRLFQNAAGCLHLGSASPGTQYLIGLLSASESPSSVTAGTLASRTGIAVPASENTPGGPVGAMEIQLPVGTQVHAALEAGPAGPTPQLLRQRNPGRWEAEQAVRASERRLVESLGGLDRVKTLLKETSYAGQKTPQMLPSVGDMITLGVGGKCDGRATVSAQVRYVGTASIWLEDTANPGPAFTTAELSSLDSFYTGVIRASLNTYFGPTTDLDDNSRILILITKEVNKDEHLLGYVFSGDLVPRSYCAGGNYAEIFYGIAPDPGGVHGDAVTKDQILAKYPSLIAHEVTHLVQRSHQFYADAGEKAIWEMEGGATLSEKLVGHAAMGRDLGQNLGYSVVQGSSWYWNWVEDLALYFGYSNTGHIPGAPEQCTWLGSEDDGNTGPCDNTRAVYGVPAWLLQYVLDQYGGDYSGGRSAMMQRITQSEKSGFPTLEDVTGETAKFILTRFGMALWVDDRHWDAMESWNLFDIFDHLVPAAKLNPYYSTSAAPGLSVQIRGGSTAFLLWEPSGGHLPTAIRFRSSSDSALPDHMAFWIVRVQ